MRTILLSKSDEEYLQKCAVELGLAYGIICGQQAEADKFVVVHLAKNTEEEVDQAAPEATIQNVEDIDTQALANQWISASKMLPGSFTILGAFVTGVQANIVDEETFRDAKKLLYDVHNLLLQGNTIVSSVENTVNPDYLFLAYSTASKRAVCKSYSHATNGGVFTAMDCRFVDKPFEWYNFECSYELEDVFPIIDAAPKVNIERQFQRTIDAVRKCLEASVIFVQNEMVDESLTLDAYVKKKNSKGGGGVSPHTKTQPSQQQHRPDPADIYRASIYLPVKCQVSNDHAVKVRQFNGTVRFCGAISSRIWCNPKNTLADVKRFIREDILRSLAARIQVYCDGLTEPNINTEAIFISEPPRRVYFNLPGHRIQFSEYIFRGEAATVAVAQAKQVLDIDINSENIVDDVEALPDYETFSPTPSEDTNSVLNTEKVGSDGAGSHHLTRTMYMLGITVALLVLFVSVLLHYMMR